MCMYVYMGVSISPASERNAQTRIPRIDPRIDFHRSTANRSIRGSIDSANRSSWPWHTGCRMIVFSVVFSFKPGCLENRYQKLGCLRTGLSGWLAGWDWICDTARLTLWRGRRISGFLEKWTRFLRLKSVGCLVRPSSRSSSKNVFEQWSMLPWGK